MVLLMFAAIGGGLATAAAMAPFGAVAALLSAPLGGSLCALVAALGLAGRRPVADLDSQADTMVATLRDLATQAAKPEADLGAGAEDLRGRANSAR